jgi:hypothetical protein
MPGPDEYIITGTGLEISFSPAVSEPENVSFISIDESKFKNGPIYNVNISILL